MSNSADELNNQFEFQLIPLDLIDEPEEPERENMDPKALAELALSIAEVGLIKPLIVLPKADRFQVDAGHRRLLGCRLARYSPVPCRVKVNDTVSAISIMIHENAHTEPVNAIEEARFYAKALTRECGDDVDVLCAMVKRGRDFVEGRLNLLNGWPRVIVALSESQIGVGVARELNKVKDPHRLLLLLDTAINQGASVRTVTDWVRDANLMDPIQLPQSDTSDSAAPALLPPEAFAPQCFFCGTKKHPSTMQFVYLHGPCADIVRSALNLPEPDMPNPIEAPAQV